MFRHHIRQLLLAAFLFYLGAAAAMAAGPASGEALVSALYKNFGCPGPSVAAPNCESPEAQQRKAITEQDKTILGKYFDASLVALLLKERRCVLKTRELCNLDFDLLYASQDPGAANLSIKTADANQVHVSFRYPSTGERITIRYRLVQTPKGPRIGDVIYEDTTSLRKLLMRKLG